MRTIIKTLLISLPLLTISCETSDENEYEVFLRTYQTPTPVNETSPDIAPTPTNSPIYTITTSIRDTIIKVPLNSLKLTSTKGDATNSIYSSIQLYGPSALTFSNPTFKSIIISNFDSGTYKIQLAIWNESTNHVDYEYINITAQPSDESKVQEKIFNNLELSYYDVEWGGTFYFTKINNLDKSLSNYKAITIYIKEEGNKINSNWFKIDTDYNSDYYYQYMNDSNDPIYETDLDVNTNPRDNLVIICNKLSDPPKSISVKIVY